MVVFQKVHKSVIFKKVLSLTLKRTLLAYKLGIDCIKKWCLLGVSSGCQNWICLDEV
jgi:hypothetical protein